MNILTQWRTFVGYFLTQQLLDQQFSLKLFGLDLGGLDSWYSLVKRDWDTFYGTPICIPTPPNPPQSHHYIPLVSITPLKTNVTMEHHHF